VNGALAGGLLHALNVLGGDLGVSPGAAITGFPPGIVTPPGAIHAADAVAAQAQVSLTTQYNALASAACSADLTGQNLGNRTLTPGVYCFSTSAQLTGPLTLDAQGNASASFIFKIGSTLTSASGSSVGVINGGNPCGVAWQIGSSATLGTTTSFVGNLIALTSITLNTGANIIGRALARNGAVTLDTNNISFALCNAGGGPPPVPTLSTWMMIVLVGLLALAGLATLRRRKTYDVT
jgi:type VI secretion system secreted protein VgrG